MSDKETADLILIIQNAVVKDVEESLIDPLNKVTLYMCSLCLDGAGGECHVPGCVFWMMQSPEISIRERILDFEGCIERVHSGEEHEFAGNEADCTICGEGRCCYLHTAK